MTASKFPKIPLWCLRGQHWFDTAAGPSQTVKCTTCRVGRRVPAARPRTDREAKGWTDPAAPASAAPADPDAGSESGSWDQMTRWDGRLAMRDARPEMVPGVDECEKCAGPLQWEPGRTMVYCPGCKGGLRTSPEIDVYYDRADAQAAQVTTRTAPEPPAPPGSDSPSPRIADQGISSLT
jgi:hypothetical protein